MSFGKPVLRPEMTGHKRRWPVLLCDEADGGQDAGRERLQVVHVLRLEAFAVLGVQSFVIGQRAFGQFVDGEVGDGDADGVRTGVEQGANFEFIGWTPDGAGAAAVDEDDGGFANWRSEERRVGKECRSRWSPD